MEIKTKKVEPDQKNLFRSIVLTNFKPLLFRFLAIAVAFTLFIGWKPAFSLISICLSIILIGKAVKAWKYLNDSQNKNTYTSYYYHFDDEYLRVKWKNGIEVQYPWDMANKVKFCEEGVNISIENSYFRVPESLFKDPKDKKDFYQFIKGKFK